MAELIIRFNRLPENDYTNSRSAAIEYIWIGIYLKQVINYYLLTQMLGVLFCP